MYVIEVPGFERAEQSVAPSGADGYQSTYVSAETGAMIHLVVDRGTVDEAACGCERDGDAWYRAGGTHAWLRAEDGHTVTVDADAATVDRDTLRAALTSARPATDAELDEILPETGSRRPVERGDLPPAGDAAPQDPENASG